MDETTGRVWEFIGWLLFGDHVTVAVPFLAGLVVIGWWLRGKRDERRRLSKPFTVLCWIDGCDWEYTDSDLTAVQERFRWHQIQHEESR